MQVYTILSATHAFNSLHGGLNLPYQSKRTSYGPRPVCGWQTKVHLSPVIRIGSDCPLFLWYKLPWISWSPIVLEFVQRAEHLPLLGNTSCLTCWGIPLVAFLVPIISCNVSSPPAAVTFYVSLPPIVRGSGVSMELPTQGSHLLQYLLDHFFQLI